VSAFSIGQNFVTVFEFIVIFGALNIFVIDGLEIRSAVIQIVVVFANFRVLFGIDESSILVLHHSAKGSGSIVIHSSGTGGSPETVVSEFDSSETIKLTDAINNSDIRFNQIDVINSESCE